MSHPIETDFPTDSDFLLSRRAVLAAGALTALALSLPALPARAAEINYSDTKALRFLQELTRLQSDFSLRAALSSPAAALPTRETDALNLIARQDNEVMRWFAAARGKYGVSAFAGPSTLNQASSRPLPQSRFNAGTFTNREQIFARALEIKGLTVGAIHGAVGAAKDPQLVQALAAIGGVQGRHLAMLSELAGQPAFVAFETPLSMREVAGKLAPYGFNTEVIG